MVIEEGQLTSLDWQVAFYGTDEIKAQKIAKKSLAIGRHAYGYVSSWEGTFSSLLNWNVVRALKEAVYASSPVEYGPNRMKENILIGIEEAVSRYSRFLHENAGKLNSEHIYALGELPESAIEMIKSGSRFGDLTVALSVETLEEAKNVVAMSFRKGLARGAIIADPRATYYQSLDWCSAKYMEKILDASRANRNVMSQIQEYRNRLETWVPASEYMRDDC